MDKYTQELKTGQFMLEECEEAIKSGEKEDVTLAYERICGIIKMLENTKVGITEAMLGDYKAIGEVQEWNNRQKEELQPLREMQKRLRLEIEKQDELMHQRKQQQELNLQKKIMEEQTRISQAQEREKSGDKDQKSEVKRRMVQKKT